MELVERQSNVTILNEAKAAGLPPLVAEILSKRSILVPADIFIKPKLSQLSSPYSLPDIEVAAERIVRAIVNNEVIALETDHDCDGQTAHAVLHEALVQYFGCDPKKVLSFIGHRLEEGYGLSQPLCDRILAHNPKPSVVITADNGSTDEPRIAQLKAAGIDVIVTDHHAIPVAGIPLSALATINPTRADSAYPDPFIAGCMVAWLLVAAVAAKLRQAREVKNVQALLDYVAVGTIADCVSMSRSLNNRIVVQYGLSLINTFARPCWRAVKPLIHGPVRSEDLGFTIGPLLNSDGRLDSALGSVSFLLSKTDVEARAWVSVLADSNRERKAIQKNITQMATEKAAERVAQGYHSLALYLQDSHPGVHGISASRIKDMYGLPTILLADKMTDENVITGSARSIDGFDMRAGLAQVAQTKPDWLIAFGGHKGAAGITLQKSGLDAFVQAFELVCKNIPAHLLGPKTFHDGSLANYSPQEWAQALSMLEPFGREFESPSLCVYAHPLQHKPFGAGHARLVLKAQSEKEYPCVWFSASEPVYGRYILRPQVSYFNSDGVLENQVVYMQA